LTPELPLAIPSLDVWFYFYLGYLQNSHNHAHMAGLVWGSQERWYKLNAWHIIGTLAILSLRWKNRQVQISQDSIFFPCSFIVRWIQKESVYIWEPVIWLFVNRVSTLKWLLLYSRWNTKC
jgi:hypothetical protein